MGKNFALGILASTLLLALTACLGGGITTDFSKGSGVLSGWPLGKIGTMEFRTTHGVAETIRLSEVDGDGKFSYLLKVPTRPETLFIGGTGCSGNPSISDPSVKMSSIAFYAAEHFGTRNPVMLSNVATLNTVPQVGYRSANFIYVDKDVTVSGSIKCEGPKLIFNFRFSKGWNLAVATIKQVETLNGVVGTAEIEGVSVSSIPSDLKFHYVVTTGSAISINGLLGF